MSGAIVLYFRGNKHKKILNFIVCLASFVLFSFVLTASNISQENNYSFAYLNSDNLQIKEAKSPVLIVVDPGHGGDDLGTYYGNMIEKEINMDICQRLAKMLKEENINYVFTREADINIDVKERAAFANKLNATLFLSVHNNNMEGQPNYKGTETLYSSLKNPVDSKVDGKRFAQIVQNELVRDLKMIDNGIILRNDLAVTRRTTMPAVIAEIGYISNQSDRSKLSTESFREKAARALCNAVKITLNEMGAGQDESGKWVK